MAGGAENADPPRAEVGLNPLETLKETLSADQDSAAPPITLKSLKIFRAVPGDLQTGANLTGLSSDEPGEAVARAPHATLIAAVTDDPVEQGRISAGMAVVSFGVVRGR